VLKCPSDTELTDVNSTFCFHVAQSLYPKDIWTLDSDVGRQLRLAFYGRPDVVRPLPSYDRLAPNIGHVIWVGGGKMSFVFFVGVLSMLYVAKLDVVYVHGDKPPTGEYWDLLIQTRQNIQFVLRENARQVFVYITFICNFLDRINVRCEHAVKTGTIVAKDAFSKRE